MAYDRPTLADIDRRNQAELPLATASEAMRRNFYRPMARALSGAEHGLRGYGVWRYMQMFPQTCDDDVLEQYHAQIHLRGGRKAASAATGGVRINGTAGMTIAAGAVVNRNDGATYALPDGAVVGATGMVTANLVCLQAGEAGNTEAGASLQLASPVAGIDSALIVLSPGLSGGADIEDIEDLRQRVIEARHTPGEVGTTNDYEAWAKEVAGVTRAWAAAKVLGYGTMSVYIMRDGDSVTAYPDANECATVLAHLNETAVPFGEIFVFAPIKKVQNLAIQLSPNTAAIQAAATTAIKALFTRESSPVMRVNGVTVLPAQGVTVPLSHIIDVISDVQGEWTHKITSPTADIVCGVGEMLELGVITWL